MEVKALPEASVWWSRHMQATERNDLGIRIGVNKLNKHYSMQLSSNYHIMVTITGNLD